jgi:methanogenic corrinoid protein MtbC1
MADRGRRGPAGELLYNIKAVVRQTGIPADTLRAWERRHGMPHPRRGETGRRLYSEQDIAAIRWLRERTAGGMAISQAIQQLRARGDEALAGAPPRAHGPCPQQALARDLLGALLQFNESAANAIVEAAFALYEVDDVCLQLFTPVLVEIGERWHRREATVAQEHFASHLILRRLAALFQAYARASGRGTIVAACARGEQHELGLLMLAVFLARRSWHVVYLGASVPVADLIPAVARLRPALVCLSASSGRTARALIDVVDALNRLPPPHPLVAFGGLPFNADEQLRGQVHAHFLGTNAAEAVARVERLLG